MPPLSFTPPPLWEGRACHDSLAEAMEKQNASLLDLAAQPKLYSSQLTFNPISFSRHLYIYFLFEQSQQSPSEILSLELNGFYGMAFVSLSPWPSSPEQFLLGSRLICFPLFPSFLHASFQLPYSYWQNTYFLLGTRHKIIRLIWPRLSQSFQFSEEDKHFF